MEVGESGEAQKRVFRGWNDGTFDGGRPNIVFLCVHRRKRLKKRRYTVAESAVQAWHGLSTTLRHVRCAETLEVTIFKYC